MVEEKVQIFADYISFLKLLSSQEFIYGKDLKSIIRKRATVYLMIDEEDMLRDWENTESALRKGCDAHDIPCPHALPKLNEVFKRPHLCYQVDPHAIWLINTSEENIGRFRDYFGVWMLNVDTITDETFFLHHKREYQRNDVITGSTNNGWKNYLEELMPKKSLPPMNAIVINDRYLIYNTNENNAERNGFYGLNNIEKLMDAILPQNLQIPFHLFIFCQHPQLQPSITDQIIKRFEDTIRSLRSYPIVIEFVYDTLSSHKRTFHSNYFLFDVDRTYNAFYASDYTKLNGENFFCLESYHNDPRCSGDTNYTTARNKIHIIKENCNHVIQHPHLDLNYEKVARADLNGETTIQNRLFS